MVAATKSPPSSDRMTTKPLMRRRTFVARVGAKQRQRRRVAAFDKKRRRRRIVRTSTIVAVAAAVFARRHRLYLPACSSCRLQARAPRKNWSDRQMRAQFCVLNDARGESRARAHTRGGIVLLSSNSPCSASSLSAPVATSKAFCVCLAANNWATRVTSARGRVAGRVFFFLRVALILVALHALDFARAASRRPNGRRRQ